MLKRLARDIEVTFAGALPAGGMELVPLVLEAVLVDTLLILVLVYMLVLGGVELMGEGSRETDTCRECKLTPRRRKDWWWELSSPPLVALVELCLVPEDGFKDVCHNDDLISTSLERELHKDNGH